MPRLGVKCLSGATLEAYYFDCEGLARRELAGVNIAAKLVTWAEYHNVTTEEMRALVTFIEMGWRDDFENRLADYKRMKAKGTKTAYRFEWGKKLPIDDAIALTEQKLSRIPR